MVRSKGKPGVEITKGSPPAKGKKATPAKEAPAKNIKKRSPPPKDPPTTKGKKGSPRALVPPVASKQARKEEGKKGGRGSEEEDTSPVRKIPPKASAKAVTAPKRAPRPQYHQKSSYRFLPGGCSEEKLLPNESKKVTMPDMVAMTASEVLETLEMNL